MGECLYSDGRNNEAEKLLVKAMTTRKRVLGPEHPNTLTSMSNLSSIYFIQGRWKEAEELQVQVLETWKQVLGPEHPDTLTSMSNLSYTWKSLGNIQAAIALMKECFELRTKALGPDHPATTSSSHALSSWKAADSDSWHFGRILLISVAVIPLLALAITGLQRFC